MLRKIILVAMPGLCCLAFFYLGSYWTLSRTKANYDSYYFIRKTDIPDLFKSAAKEPEPIKEIFESEDLAIVYTTGRTKYYIHQDGTVEAEKFRQEKKEIASLGKGDVQNILTRSKKLGIDNIDQSVVQTFFDAFSHTERQKFAHTRPTGNHILPQMAPLYTLSTAHGITKFSIRTGDNRIRTFHLPSRANVLPQDFPDYEPCSKVVQLNSLIWKQIKEIK